MKRVANLRRLKKSRQGLLVLFISQLGISYGLVSFAIYSGNLIAWMATIVFFTQAVKNLVNLVRSLVHGTRQTRQTS